MMTERNTTHASFTIERIYNAKPARVFAAFAQPEAKARWFAAPEEWGPDEVTFDFRVGGIETSTGGPKNGPVHYFEAVYQNIVPNERIIYSYYMTIDGAPISVSLTTIEFEPKGKGTRLIFTEHGVYLDDYDDAGSREHGTRELLDALGVFLQSQEATA